MMLGVPLWTALQGIAVCTDREMCCDWPSMPNGVTSVIGGLKFSLDFLELKRLTSMGWTSLLVASGASGKSVSNTLVLCNKGEQRQCLQSCWL